MENGGAGHLNTESSPVMSQPFLLVFISLLAVPFIVFSQSVPINNEEVFVVVEHQPTFPGGQDSLRSWLIRNVRYPETARQAKVTGRVLISFVVRRTGQLTDIEIRQGLGHGCDEEAERLIKAMPNWLPGSQSGTLLNVRYNMPIFFGVPDPYPLKRPR